MRGFVQSLLALCCAATLVAAQYGGYGKQSSTAVSSPLDTVKLAIANRSPDDAQRYGVDIQLVKRAQNHLDSGLRIPPTARMDIEWANVRDIPMIWPAYQFYLQYGVGTTPNAQRVRKFFLSLIEAGMSADVDYLGENLIDGSWIRLPLADCLNTREDVEVCLALMRAGHPTDPVIGNWNAHNDYNQQYVQGVGYLNLIAVGASGVPIMRVLYRMDREVQNGLKTPEQSIQDNLLEKYLAHTPAIYDVVDTLKREEPVNDRVMQNTMLKELDSQIEMAELQGLFNFTDIDLREIEICAPWNDYNPLHFAAFMDKPAIVNQFTEEFNRLEEGSAYKDQVASSTLKALEFRSRFAGRNPLHLAGVRFGHDSAIFRALLTLEVAANGDDSRIQNMQDDFGLTPWDYNGPDDSVNEASINGYTEGTPLPERPITDGDFNGFTYTEADSGGWGVAPHDAALQEAAKVNLKGRSRCDITEVDGMPTAAELGLWLERNQPVMFRNAVRDWGIRDTWTKENFQKKYSDREIQTSAIPYASSFDSTTANTIDMTTMGAYMDSWGTSSEKWDVSSVPRYMFSGQFTDENPDIDDDIDEFLEFLGSLPYPTKVMAKQLFVGPALSGAPLHWHNTAMNAIAYGRKHWYLVPPNQTFYSVWPTKNMVKNELDALLDEGVNVLQCSQNAGDLLLVGQSWGHATLNQHPTIGMAIEFTYRVLSTEMQLPSYMKEMATPSGQAALQASGGKTQKEDQNLFIQLDTDRNGRLSKTEFSALGSSNDVRTLFRTDDVNRDGFISWSEFTGPKGSAEPQYARAQAVSSSPASARGGNAGATYLQQRSSSRREL